jgi:hypothetical protein
MAVFDIQNNISVGDEKTILGQLTKSILPTNEPTIYRMRAYNTSLSQYVFWDSGGSPDSTGIKSGYNTGDLQRIVVLSKSV